MATTAFVNCRQNCCNECIWGHNLDMFQLGDYFHLLNLYTGFFEVLIMKSPWNNDKENRKQTKKKVPYKSLGIKKYNKKTKALQ